MLCSKKNNLCSKIQFTTPPGRGGGGGKPDEEGLNGIFGRFFQKVAIYDHITTYGMK